MMGSALDLTLGWTGQHQWVWSMFQEKAVKRCCFSGGPGASQVALVVKNLSANAGEKGEVNLIPGWGRSPGGGHGSPLQYSCLENPMDRGAWWATVRRVTKSWTRLV